MSLGEFFGFLGGALGITQGIPQARRVKKLGHSVGVSLTTWALIYGSNLGWFAYGLVIHSPSIIVTNIFASVLSGYVILALRPGNRRVRLFTVISYFVAPAVSYFLLPLDLLRLALIPFIFSRVPQLAHTIKMAKGAHKTAISLGTLAISLGSMAMWELYAIFTKNTYVVVTAGIPMIILVIILVVELYVLKTQRDIKEEA